MADPGRPTILFWRQESVGFGDSKWGCVPETETLGHRPVELGGWPEIRETGVTSAFLPGCTERSGSRAVGSSRPEIGRLPLSFLSSRALRKAFREQKAPKSEPEQITQPDPWQGQCNSASGKDI